MKKRLFNIILRNFVIIMAQKHKTCIIKNGSSPLGHAHGKSTIGKKQLVNTIHLISLILLCFVSIIPPASKLYLIFHSNALINVH